MKYHKLYYNLGESSPLYPGTPKVSLRKYKSQEKGDSCNTCVITFSNHSGTHIDAPRHFFKYGATINDFTLKELSFRKPVILNCFKRINELIEIRDLSALKKEKKADFLIIKTGFSKLRDKFPRMYEKNNPCLKPSAAEWLKKNLPNLKGIGIDCISISSKAFPDFGKQTHKILLGNSKKFFGKPVLIVEDMFLPENLARLDELIIMPFFIEGADSVPCSCLGINYD